MKTSHDLYKKLELFIKKAHETQFSGHMLFLDENIEPIEFDQGYAVLETKEKFTSQSLFAIASGTKFLTALAIGQLIDQNKLALTTYAHDIVDLGFKDYDEHITIKHLLSHTSGMPDYLDEETDDGSYAKIENNKLLYVRDYLTYFPDKPMDFKPGLRFKYHNGAFVYLALIIEALTSMSYQDYINNKLLKPIGINKSGIFKSTDLMQHKVMGYVNTKNAKTHIGYIPLMSGGDGGAYFSATDFKKLITSFYNGAIISTPLVRLFLEPNTIVDQAKGIYYGLGLWLKKENGKIIPYVEGGDAGVSFKCVFYESNHFAWIASNTDDGVWRLVDIFNTFAFEL